MKRNMKAEYISSMDAIRFSPEQKAAMAQGLMARMEENTMRKHTFTGRKLVLIAAAAALLLVTLTGAAAFSRWSRSAQTRYNPSEDVKEQAEKSGLSVMLEETSGTDEQLSVTDQGITITAVQTIVDDFRAEITFRIEGFDLPEDQIPSVWPIITIDGQDDFYVMQTGQFFTGTTWNEAGEWVYVSTGEPVRYADDEFQSAILDYVADDGSLEYTHYISFSETDGRWLGKEISVTFNSINIDSDQKAGPAEPLVEGCWELNWTLTGTSDSITITPNAKIGDSGVILLDAEIRQKSIRARYLVDAYWDGWDELVTLPQAVYGVRMKDGSEHFLGAGTGGFEDQENMIYFTEFDISDAILDVSQVESLMFQKGWEADENGEMTVHTFYYIPIS